MTEIFSTRSYNRFLEDPLDSADSLEILANSLMRSIGIDSDQMEYENRTATLRSLTNCSFHTPPPGFAYQQPSNLPQMFSQLHFLPTPEILQVDPTLQTAPKTNKPATWDSPVVIDKTNNSDWQPDPSDTAELFDAVIGILSSFTGAKNIVGLRTLLTKKYGEVWVNRFNKTLSSKNILWKFPRYRELLGIVLHQQSKKFTLVVKDLTSMFYLAPPSKVPEEFTKWSANEHPLGIHAQATTSKLPPMKPYMKVSQGMKLEALSRCWNLHPDAASGGKLRS